MAYILWWDTHTHCVAASAAACVHYAFNNPRCNTEITDKPLCTPVNIHAAGNIDTPARKTCTCDQTCSLHAKHIRGAACAYVLEMGVYAKIITHRLFFPSCPPTPPPPTLRRTTHDRPGFWHTTGRRQHVAIINIHVCVCKWRRASSTECAL